MQINFFDVLFVVKLINTVNISWLKWLDRFIHETALIVCFYFLKYFTKFKNILLLISTGTPTIIELDTHPFLVKMDDLRQNFYILKNLVNNKN